MKHNKLKNYQIQFTKNYSVNAHSAYVC